MTIVNLLFYAPRALYIDPSVMTYALQIAVGAIITLGTVAGLLWRKFKKKVKKNFNIDENAKKEMEEKIELIYESAEEAVTAEGGETDVK